LTHRYVTHAAILATLALGLGAGRLVSAQESMQVTVTHYADSGVTYSGGSTHVGVAACSWNIPMFATIRFADGREYRCEDRGQLGNGRCPSGLTEPMRTAATLPVDVLRHIAVEAEGLEAGRKPLLDEPSVELAADALALPLAGQLSAMLAPVIVHVVNTQKDGLTLPTTDTSRAVDAEHLSAQPLYANTTPLSVPLGVLLAPRLSLVQTNLTRAAIGRGHASSARDTLPGRDTAPMRPQVNLTMASPARFTHDTTGGGLSLVTTTADAFGSRQADAPLNLNSVGETSLAHLASRLDGARAPSTQQNTIDFDALNTTHAQIIPNCGWIDIWVGDVALARQMGRYTATVEVIRP
jgi:hypothetical protein